MLRSFKIAVSPNGLSRRYIKRLPVILVDDADKEFSKKKRGPQGIQGEKAIQVY